MICVIGLGEVGFATFTEMLKKRKDVYGVDVNQALVEKLRKEGYNVGTEIKTSEVYIIAVYTSAQVLNVLRKLDFSNKPLVVIETTLDPKYIKAVKKFECDLVAFPHRLNPNDPEHYVFNLKRVLGGVTDEATKRALAFYKQFMHPDLIHVTSFEVAVLSKVVENGYRFIEIAVAQSLALDCKEKHIDFKALREATNTKWNIDIKEARDGIYGKCLPKDAKILWDYLGNEFIELALESNERYKDIVKKK